MPITNHEVRSRQTQIWKRSVLGILVSPKIMLCPCIRSVPVSALYPLYPLSLYPVGSSFYAHEPL